MGMTPADYWDGEASNYPAFRKAYQQKIENEQKLEDRQNWYMGQYIMAVLQAVPLLVGGLNVKPSTQLPEYPEKPFFEKAEENKKEEVRKQQEEDQMKLAMAMFQAAVTKMNKHIEKDQAKKASAGQ